MRYEIILTEVEGATSGVSVEAEALPRFGEAVHVEGFAGGIVRSVTHIVSPGLPWKARTEVRLFPAEVLAGK